jgi:hypothetical protein
VIHPRVLHVFLLLLLLRPLLLLLLLLRKGLRLVVVL